MASNNRLKGLEFSQKKKTQHTQREREREIEFFVPSLDLEHHCKQKEKSMGINTVRLCIYHHQIVETGTDTFFSIFSRFGYEILLFIEFFCWIGLDLILVLITFCFGLLGSP